MCATDLSTTVEQTYSTGNSQFPTLTPDTSGNYAFSIYNVGGPTATAFPKFASMPSKYFSSFCETCSTSLPISVVT